MSDESKITVREFEAKVLELEEILVVVRANQSELIPDYSYIRKAAANSTVTEYVEGRLKPCLGDIDFSIINGEYSQPHGRTKLSTLRQSYER